MCIKFFKTLFGLDEKGFEQEMEEMHEYQKTGTGQESETMVNSDDESSSEEIEFDEEGIYEENDAAEDYLDEEGGGFRGPGNEIEEIQNENEEVQGASDSDDEAEDLTPGLKPSSGGVMHPESLSSQILHLESTNSQKNTDSLSTTYTTSTTTPSSQVAKKKKGKVTAFKSKAHANFKSKGKKMMKKRKLKMKKKPAEKTEVK